MDALWFFLTAPARLMVVLWPIFVILPLVMAVLAVVMRALVRRRVEPRLVHPLMRSGVGWPLAVAAWTFALFWLGVSLATFVLILAAGARQY